MSAEQISCRELVELVTDYLEGTMPLGRRIAFEQHVAICPPCRGYLEEIRHVVEVAGDLTEETMPPVARDAMLSVFRDWQRE